MVIIENHIKSERTHIITVEEQGLLYRRWKYALTELVVKQVKAGGPKPLSFASRKLSSNLRLGNWELDTILGKPGTGSLVTVVDHKTRLLLGTKIEGKTVSAVQAALSRLLERMGGRSLTADNGKEFTRLGFTI